MNCRSLGIETLLNFQSSGILEEFARSVHGQSSQRQPFVQIECVDSRSWQASLRGSIVSDKTQLVHPMFVAVEQFLESGRGGGCAATSATDIVYLSALLLPPTIITWTFERYNYTEQISDSAESYEYPHP